MVRVCLNSVTTSYREALMYMIWSVTARKCSHTRTRTHTHECMYLSSQIAIHTLELIKLTQTKTFCTSTHWYTHLQSLNKNRDRKRKSSTLKNNDSSLKKYTQLNLQNKVSKANCSTPFAITYYISLLTRSFTFNVKVFKTSLLIMNEYRNLLLVSCSIDR